MRFLSGKSGDTNKTPIWWRQAGQNENKSESSSSHGTMICSKIGPKLEGVWLMKSPRASGMFHYYDSVSILWNSPTVRVFFLLLPTPFYTLLASLPPLPICFHERKKDGKNIMALFFPRLFPGKTGSILREKIIFFAPSPNGLLWDRQNSRPRPLSHVW